MIGNGRRDRLISREPLPVFFLTRAEGKNKKAWEKIWFALQGNIPILWSSCMLQFTAASCTTDISYLINTFSELCCLMFLFCHICYKCQDRKSETKVLRKCLVRMKRMSTDATQTHICQCQHISCFNFVPAFIHFFMTVHVENKLNWFCLLECSLSSIKTTSLTE